MIGAGDFLKVCLAEDFSFYTGTPCSYLKPIINYVIENPEFNFIDANNEGNAVAMAAGAVMAGKRSVVMFQNSGFGNAVNPLTSLNNTFRVPLLLIITLRGEPGGPEDEPQHELMGQITTTLLDTMNIGWSWFPETADQVILALKKACDFMEDKQLPFAFVMKKGSVEPYPLKAPTTTKHGLTLVHSKSEHINYYRQQHPTRYQALKVVQSLSENKTAVVATTGFTGRELCAIQDRANQLYMVGSMGCALSLGMGVALNKPKLNVMVVDGDGALLMRTGAMATTGAYAPDNLIHILLDNEAHESTGGQKTVSGQISFPLIAQGFGYPHVFSTDSLDQFKRYINQAIKNKGPSFIHLKTRQGVPENLSRPSQKPVQVKTRFMSYLKEH